MQDFQAGLQDFDGKCPDVECTFHSNLDTDVTDEAGMHDVIGGLNAIQTDGMSNVLFLVSQCSHIFLQVMM
jgi:hypothetical protein